MEYISTSALAKELNFKSSDLFDKLQILSWIERKNDKWKLTDLGKQKGGLTKNSVKFGEYIVWPKDISFENPQENEKIKFINATAIGKHFEISSQRLNLIFSELGWIIKDISGWQITKLGKRLNGKQFEHQTSGGTYVLWPESILVDKNLTSLFNVTVTEETITETPKKIQKATSVNFREKFPASFRTKDGHMVRSRAEVIIDNALYDYNLSHAYERKLPIDEDLYSDFFIPSKGVYIEFWGMENDPKYLERKKAKIKIYDKYDLKLIELNDADLLNLDDHLPKKLLKYGIKVF
jgi:hypothetical protein